MIRASYTPNVRVQPMVQSCRGGYGDLQHEAMATWSLQSEPMKCDVLLIGGESNQWKDGHEKNDDQQELRYLLREFGQHEAQQETDRDGY